jgi:hypothetical protein
VVRRGVLAIAHEAGVDAADADARAVRRPISAAITASAFVSSWVP